MIPADLQARLLAAWHQLPTEVRAAPATPDELASLERDLGPIPADFRWFLTTLGGGPVGPEWIDDVTQLRASHAKLAAEPWTFTDAFLIGWDGAGNPIAIHHRTGKLLVEDHNAGGIHELSPSFATFLEKGLLG